VITSHSLRKSFLSIKGIYYQATIQGQDILWLVPYRFVQRTGGDIDFRIMGTFVEFYTTLIGFVNYRLYTSVGLVYPPKFNAKSDEQGGELAAFQLEGKANATNGASHEGDEDMEINPEAQAMADRIAVMSDEEEEATEAPPALEDDDEEQTTDDIDKFEPTAPDADILPQPQASSKEVASLFAPFTFYLSREVPRASLEFILKAFGCKRVGWDSILGDGAFTTNESDPAITHQIIDRPPLPTEASAVEPTNGDASTPTAQWPRSTMPGRTYVQPQWVWDCINQGKLLRPDLYAPGAELPPHLSPWVKPKKGEYDPNLPLEAQQPDGEAEAFEDMADDDADAFEVDDDEEDKMDGIIDRDGSVEVGEGMDVAESEDDEDDSDSDDDAGAGDFDGFDDESDAESDISEGEAARLQHQRELEAEATGKKLEVKAPTKKEQNAAIRKKFDKKKRQEEEERERQKMMLSNKKRKLLKRIEYGENKRDTESENLRRKRAKLEKAKAAAEAL
jgi:pescadillo protein